MKFPELAAASCATALLAMSLSALPGGAPADARSDYRALRKEYQEAYRDYQTEQRRIATDEGAEAAKLYGIEWHPALGFVEAAWDYAEEYKGSDGAGDFLTWILINGQLTAEGDLGPFSVKALDRLVGDHAGEELDQFLSQAGFMSWGVDRCLAVLDGFHARLEGPEQRRSILVSRCVIRVDRGDAAHKKAARMDLAGLEKELAGGDLGAEIERLIFVLDNLQVGCEAPEIAARDLDGVEFKLSDYRGKVVLLDFWGDW